MRRIYKMIRMWFRNEKVDFQCGFDGLFSSQFSFRAGPEFMDWEFVFTWELDRREEMNESREEFMCWRILCSISVSLRSRYSRREVHESQWVSWPLWSACEFTCWNFEFDAEHAEMDVFCGSCWVTGNWFRISLSSCDSLPGTLISCDCCERGKHCSQCSMRPALCAQNGQSDCSDESCRCREGAGAGSWTAESTELKLSDSRLELLFPSSLLFLLDFRFRCFLCVARRLSFAGSLDFLAVLQPQTKLFHLTEAAASAAAARDCRSLSASFPSVADLHLSAAATGISKVEIIINFSYILMSENYFINIIRNK